MLYKFMGVRKVDHPRFQWVEYLRKASESLCDDLMSFIPTETRKHLIEAKKELLLALKGLVEKEIEKIEREKPKEARKVEVE